MARELAILVTARNMASGVLKDVRGDIRNIQSEARRGLTNTARNLGVAAAAGGVLVATQVKEGLDSLVELERLTAQTNAALKSTGSAAAGSVDDIRRRSEELERLTTVDDKVVQNAQNLLLTFTQIREDAFEPTLKAAIDMNAAMGGGDDSLQNVLIQVAKAVNDPITGLTALRRVGVSFTQQQKDQIKTMVEAGDVAGAQALVLGELNKEFGGSAAAQADTYAGKMAKIRDAVEDAQMALATAFLPVLERVGDELQTFLSDPKNLKNIEDFGATLAGGLEQAIDIAKKLPWDAIGTTFSLMGQGAKTVLDMFTKLPPWVQTAVLTGWGLNKLSGGALGNIAGTLIGSGAKGLLGNLRGSTPATPMFTKEVGLPGVGGPGGPGAPGTPIPGAGPLGLFLGALGAVAGGAAIGFGVGAPIFNETIQPAKDFERSQVDAIISSGDAERISAGIDTLDSTLAEWAAKPPQLRQIMQPTIDELAGQRDELKTALANIASSEAARTTASRQGQNPVPPKIDELRQEYTKQTRAAAVFDTNMLRTAERAAQNNRETAAATERGRAVVAGQGARLSAIEGLNRSSLGTLAAIRNKKTVFNPHVNVTANISNVVSISTGQILQRVNSIRQSANAGTSFAGFI